jgi:hypothetical protein
MSLRSRRRHTPRPACPHDTPTVGPLLAGCRRASSARLIGATDRNGRRRSCYSRARRRRKWWSGADGAAEAEQHFGPHRHHLRDRTCSLRAEQIYPCETARNGTRPGSAAPRRIGAGQAHRSRIDRKCQLCDTRSSGRSGRGRAPTGGGMTHVRERGSRQMCGFPGVVGPSVAVALGWDHSVLTSWRISGFRGGPYPLCQLSDIDGPCCVDQPSRAETV